MFSDNYLVKSQGSRQMQRVPLGLWGYIREETHSVGGLMGVITWKSTSFQSVFCICSLYSVGTLHLVC